SACKHGKEEQWDHNGVGRPTYEVNPKVTLKPPGFPRELTIFVSGHGPFTVYLRRIASVTYALLRQLTLIKDWVCAFLGAGHFEIHLNNRHLPLPFMLAVLQTPGILTPSIDGLLTAFHYRLSYTDCTVGNIPKQVAFVLTSVFP
ncbi:hypothetical protein AVEN_115885-1, partial [Araneus ventricosus]